MIAIFAPGQGAQTPGMLTPWLELPTAAEQIARYSDVSGLDLLRLGTTADAEEIKDTAVTQPLIVALSLVAADALGVLGNHTSVLAAGHSVGEVTAAALAGVFSPADAIALAAHRGAAMAQACALGDTGMSAVMGGDPDAVVAAIEAAGAYAANRNGAGQIVAAGSAQSLQSLAAQAPAGARVRPLAVAGAFHTPFMASAQAALADFAATLTIGDPRPLLITNYDGTAISTGHDVVHSLVAQLTRSVRWDLCQHTVEQLGITAAIELAPAGTLTGLAKRSLPNVQMIALKTPDDLAAAKELMREVSAGPQPEYTPDFRVAITPAKGVFTRVDSLDEGNRVAAGERVGTITTNRDQHPVVAPAAGEIAEWLRYDGDIVAAGLPVVRLYDGDQ